MERSPKNTKKKLRLEKLKLKTLLQVTKGINNNPDNKDLKEFYCNVLVDELKIGRVVLFNNSDNEWKRELNIGTSCVFEEVKSDLLTITEVQVLSSSDNKSLAPFDVVLPVLYKSRVFAYLLLGDVDREEIEVSPIIKHFTFIQTLTNIIIVAIENRRLFKESIEQIQVKKEMELASEMQAMLFPKNLPQNKSIEIAAQYTPHHAVGGDYYDFIELNSDEIAFCIADVSGKGVPAALLMSNFQASLRVLIQRTSSLSELVIELNKGILSNAHKEKFITAFIGKYNSKTRNLQYINAGHNPPLLLANNHFTPLTEGCTILGMFDILPSVTEKNIRIDQNAILTCFTDGIVEQTNNQEEEFSLEHLKNAVFEQKEKPMQELIKKVMTKLDQFKGEVAYKDDIALLCLRIS